METKLYIKKGFTLIELMVTISIIAILVTLATPASFYQQTKAVNYADTALQQAKVYVSYINDNYSSIYTDAKTNGGVRLIAIPSSNYSGGLSMTDIYGATACATVLYNSTSKRLDMHMYYSNGSDINSNILASANNYLHGIAGQLSSGNYVGAFDTWSVPSSEVVYSTGTCSNPPPGGLALNLNLLTSQVGGMQADNSLHRTADNTNTAGTINHFNTMQADIIMAYSPTGSSANKKYSGIYFTNTNNYNSSPYLTSGASNILYNNNVSPSAYYTGIESDIVAANASLVAKSIQPIGKVAVNSTCTSATLGRIMQDSTNPSSNIPQAGLICSYDTFRCSANPGNYCYLPITAAVSRMRNNAVSSNTFTSSQSCVISGSVIDLSIPPVYGSIATSPNTTNCSYTEIGPRTLSGSSTSITVSTTWMLVYYSGTGTCPGNSTTIGSTFTSYTYAPVITAAACTS